MPVRISAPAARARAAKASVAAWGGTAYPVSRRIAASCGASAGSSAAGSPAGQQLRPELRERGPQRGGLAAQLALLLGHDEHAVGLRGEREAVLLQRAVVLERLREQRRERRVHRMLEQARVAAGGAGGDRLALEQYDRRARLGEKGRDRAADDAGPDHRYVGRAGHAVSIAARRAGWTPSRRVATIATTA